MDTFKFTRGDLTVQLKCWDVGYDLRIGLDTTERFDGGEFSWRSVLPRVKSSYGTMTDDIRPYGSIRDLLASFIAFRDEINSTLDADISRYEDAIGMVSKLDPELPNLIRGRARYKAELTVFRMEGLDVLWERCLVAASTGPANAAKNNGGRL